MPFELFVNDVNEKGEKYLLKSIHSNSPVDVSFTNLTSRPVNLWWRNFEGRKVFYGRIEPGAKHDQSTYLTHPWQVTDVCTEQYLMIDNRLIFRVPSENVGRARQNYNITAPDSCCSHISHESACGNVY
ncbi:unnamed protein product [Spodoptera exigua]|uniref:von Hippel-Lindau disease tumour suppressor beta domain-containing protein n=1 Tax=Spodoptera exigua TaxID=7107 RepID=A0A922S9G9_SPOEX|nr:hypothetical protein HF086_017486 [Spodoptera exigua]CAH0696463.1 unnamed protein product [Spodoptera exigua]